MIHTLETLPTNTQSAVYWIWFTTKDGRHYGKQGETSCAKGGALDRPIDVIKAIKKNNNVKSVGVTELVSVNGFARRVEVMFQTHNEHYRRRDVLLGMTEVYEAEAYSSWRELVPVWANNEEMRIRNDMIMNDGKRISNLALQTVKEALAGFSPKTVLDMCSGDGAMSEFLADDAEVVMVEEDKSVLPKHTKNVMVINQDALLVNPSRIGLFDCVLTNPPFSRRDEHDQQSAFYYWGFITHAQKFVAPGGVLVFIAPDAWESRLNEDTRNGRYEVVAKSVPFVGAPSASVIKWTHGPFEVVGGRGTRSLPVSPEFNVIVHPEKKGRKVLGPNQASTSQFGKKVFVEGEEAPSCAPVFEGSDAVEAAKWVNSKFNDIKEYFGADASGKFRITANRARMALRK